MHMRPLRHRQRSDNETRAERWINLQADVARESIINKLARDGLPPFRHLVAAPPEFVDAKREVVAQKIGDATIARIYTEMTPTVRYDPEASMKATDEFPAVSQDTKVIRQPDDMVLVFSPVETPGSSQ